MRQTILSVRMGSRDLKALDALAGCLQMTRGEAIREALREAALKRGVWNVSESTLQAAAQPLITELQQSETD